jgi:hypothetical protein
MSSAKPQLENRLYVPVRFEKTVITHILKNVSKVDFSVPLILGIHGPSGEGKTKQSEIILEKLNIEWVVISGGELEHKMAGRPGELIRDRYLEASKKFDPKGKASTLLINDFDTGVGMWGEEKKNAIFQYTTNLQIVYATLMNLADHPTIVDGTPCNRVPIIITGNNFGILHEPLTRDGRMTKFKWEPTRDEKFEVVKSILSDLLIPPNQIEIFFEKHRQRKVAFFAHVKNTIIDDTFLELQQQQPLEGLVYYVRTHDIGAWVKTHRFSLEDLETAAENVLKESLI